MRVRFFAYLRNITGCVEADIPYRETAGALARLLCERYGEKLRQKIFPAGGEPRLSASAEVPGNSAGKSGGADKPEYGIIPEGKNMPESSAGAAGPNQSFAGSPPAEEEFGPEIIFLINGRHVTHLGGPAAPLNPDDRVDVFPVVAGG